jgi:hypothetical protein
MAEGEVKTFRKKPGEWIEIEPGKRIRALRVSGGQVLFELDLPPDTKVEAVPPCTQEQAGAA